MLDTIGVEHFGQMLQAIPASLRNPEIRIPESLSEHEIRDLLGGLAKKNLNSKDHKSYLGAGAYEHYIPSVVQMVLMRNEFYTAYTPYQAEASQGSLQAIFEYQSMICELTGMDAANGSHYDGSTAVAEAVLLSLSKTRRRKVLIARSLNPEYKRVIQTYLSESNLAYAEIPFDANGALDREQLKQLLTDEIACVVVATPNFLGLEEDLTNMASWVHEKGALFILVSNPLALGYFKTPAEWGADIACGEGQPLGIPPSLGGPWLGYFATTRALVRQIPGRLVGLTKDTMGNRAFCLTLQAREQHIRRERAASNICTNQALCAIAACAYLSCLGKEGLKEVAALNMDRAWYFRDEIIKLPGVKLITKGPIFNEFTVQLPKSVSAVNQALLSHGIMGGFDLETVYPELTNTTVLCATEVKTKADIDFFLECLKAVLS